MYNIYEVQNAVGIIGNHPVPPIIIVDNNKDHVIILHIIINVNSILMIEPHKMLLPIMHTKGKNWITNVAFIVEYQPPIENMVP